ncbi:MAG: hypothetical protein R2696_16150 [Microthrixaceae bacterium]
MSRTFDLYDLIVIGAGMAGSAAAEKCATAGWLVRDRRRPPLRHRATGM